MPEPPHAPPPPPPTFLWSKEPGPSEESPLVPEAPESLRRRFAAPLPSIPWPYSCFKARRSATLTTIALLYLGILGKSIGDAALYATLPAVRAATGYPAVLTQLPAAGTVVYAVGKAVGVLTVSAVGGRNMILLALAGGTLLFFFTDGRQPPAGGWRSPWAFLGHRPSCAPVGSKGSRRSQPTRSPGRCGQDARRSPMGS